MHGCGNVWASWRAEAAALAVGSGGSPVPEDFPERLWQVLEAVDQGVGAELVAPFESHSAASAPMGRSVRYVVKEKESERTERAHFEKIGGVWYLQRVELEDDGRR